MLMKVRELLHLICCERGPLSVWSKESELRLTPAPGSWPNAASPESPRRSAGPNHGIGPSCSEGVKVGTPCWKGAPLGHEVGELFHFCEHLGVQVGFMVKKQNKKNTKRHLHLTRMTAA